MSVKIDDIPRNLRIAHFDFKIELQEISKAHSDRLYGKCRPFDQSIELQEEFVSIEQAVDTVLHEVTHAIFYAYGIHDEDNEERTVAALAGGWAQIFRDNPELHQWIGRVYRDRRE